MSLEDLQKSNGKRRAQIGRRELLKSALAVTAGLAAAAPCLESRERTINGDSPLPEATSPPQACGSDSAENLADVRAGRRVDVHLHAILPEYTKALQRAGVTESSFRKTTANTPQGFLDATSELGIDIAIWLPFSGSGIYVKDDASTRYLTETTNEAIAALAANAPKKFGFYAILPLPNVAASLKQMEYALDSLHADGIAFLSTQDGLYIGDPAFEDLYAEMNRRSVMAFVHPARPTYPEPLKVPPAFIEYTFETTRVAVNLIYNGVMKRYPNIKWVLAHAGGALPYLPMRLEALQGDDVQKPTFLERVPEGYLPYLERFYYDVAMAGAAGPIFALTAITDSSHIFYGSDWPYVPKKYIVEQVVRMKQMPQFAGDRLPDMERENALHHFRRFS
ncbi:MAG: amidohydrolase family protein [Blastocatellia bacterium]